MRKNLGAKEAVYPMPVFIIGTFDKQGVANAMNAAWGGISEEKEISICISPEHKTTKNILHKKAFTVSMADAKNVVSADYVGVVSGNKTTDKIQRAGWTVIASTLIDAPIFQELPLALECRLKSYDENSCRLVGEIINVSVDQSILNEKGQVDLTKFFPIVYDPMNHEYYALGNKVGKAFFDGNKLI